MLPEAFLERMRRMLGEEYGDFLGAFGQERYHALRLNNLKRRADGGNAAQWQSFAHLTKVPWAEDGYYYEPSDRPGRHPYHEAGVYYIQEPSAMVPAELLGVQPGERILDLCAAPGGKSTQIAAKLRGRGFLLCNEIHPARARILSENIERMGIPNACVTNESPERLAEFFPEYFDRILVDAPCSGEGMFRKNDVACGEWSPENVEMCAGRQAEILEYASRMLRPGGKLAYSTCTFAPEENEGSVSRFLQRHGEFAICPVDKAAMGLAGGDKRVCCAGRADWVRDPAPGLENTLRLWPHRIKGEGHYAALLGKAGNGTEEIRPVPPNGPVKGIAARELGDLTDFCAGTLALPGRNLLAELGEAAGLRDESVCIRFGENLYLVPADFPSLGGLRVLRPGLHLGERKKNRFEPSHALALALDPDCALHTWNLASDAVEIAAYLSGQTFPARGEKGWYLLCVDGFSVGWGKLASGTMKNHYPRGLRRPMA